MIRLTLPIPPLLNSLYRVSGRRIYKDGRAAIYRREVWCLAKEQGVKVTKEEVELDVKWFRERKTGDIDAILKCLLDSLEDVLYEKDSQIKKLTIEKFYNKLEPRVELCCKYLGASKTK
jgi:Holliday junction resolvase RusA-like endonuclease